MEVREYHLGNLKNASELAWAAWLASLVVRILVTVPPLPLAPFITRSLLGQYRRAGKAQLYVGTYTHDMGAGGPGGWHLYGRLGCRCRRAQPAALSP